MSRDPGLEQRLNNLTDSVLSLGSRIGQLEVSIGGVTESLGAGGHSRAALRRDVASALQNADSLEISTTTEFPPGLTFASSIAGPGPGVRIGLVTVDGPLGPLTIFIDPDYAGMLFAAVETEERHGIKVTYDMVADHIYGLAYGTPSEWEEQFAQLANEELTAALEDAGGDTQRDDADADYDPLEAFAAAIERLRVTIAETAERTAVELERLREDVRGAAR